MSVAAVNGAVIDYTVVGQEGPFVVAMSGGREPIGEIAALTTEIAKSGIRVILHDRRNCGYKTTFPKEQSNDMINEAVRLASQYRMETGSVWLSWKEIQPLMLKVQAAYRTTSDPYDLKEKVFVDG